MSKELKVTFCLYKGDLFDRCTQTNQRKEVQQNALSPAEVSPGAQLRCTVVTSVANELAPRALVLDCCGAFCGSTLIVYHQSEAPYSTYWSCPVGDF